MNNLNQNEKSTPLARRAVGVAAILGAAAGLSGCETLTAAADFGLDVASVAIEVATGATGSGYQVPSYFAPEPQHATTTTTSTGRPQFSPSSGSGATTTRRSTSASTQSRPHRSAVHCVSFDRTSNSLADFLVNSCSVAIRVQWADEGSCGDARCAGGVQAGGRQSIYPLKGRVRFAACFSPALVTNWDGIGDGKFDCR